MKIGALPPKSQLTYCNIQYYNNGHRQGAAEHVVTVTYSTHSDETKAKSKHNQRVVLFNLKAEPKAINRLIKDHRGEEDKNFIKAELKQLKKEKDVSTMFGFRRVQYKLKHKFTKGQWFHKNTLDPDTFIFLFFHPDNTVEIKIQWAGETIETKFTMQQSPVPNQSLMYAYWTNEATEEELIARIKELKNGKQQSNNDANFEQVNESEYDVEELADASDIGAGEEVEASASCEGEGEQRSPQADCTPAPSNNELGPTSGINNINNGRAVYSPSFVEHKTRTTGGVGKRIQRSKVESNDPFAGTAFDSQVLDRFASSPFAAEPVEPHIDLGTTFRF